MIAPELLQTASLTDDAGPLPRHPAWPRDFAAVSNRAWLRQRDKISYPYLNTVETITDPQLMLVVNVHQLRKAPRAMRNFSYLKEFFY